jgi:hypothetical protein
VSPSAILHHPNHKTNSIKYNSNQKLPNITMSIQQDSALFDPLTLAADRNPDLCPWMSGPDRLREAADEDAMWLTVELKESMNYLDDENLLRFVLTQIQVSNAVVDVRAQHYLRPRCLSIPSMGLSDTYAVCQAQTAELVEWWIGEIRAGTAYLDRGVLFGHR